jgi:D-sedoheptulose 7-phosphate isomerase
MSERANRIEASLGKSAAAIEALRNQAPVIAQIAEEIAESLRKGGTLFLCGNGGSAAQCQHIAAEFTGRFRLERRGLRAVSLTTDTSVLTAIGNDYGFDQVFARQLEALAKRDDVLIGLSTSGNSANVVHAFEKAREIGVTTIALIGPKGGDLAGLADVCLAAPGDETSVVQECHIAALHTVCEIAERDLSN